MKKKRHLRTRLIVTLVGLTCAVLIAVAVAFNLSVRGYITSRVSAQLDSVSSSITDERRGSEHGKPFDERPDRFTGSRGNAVLIRRDGSILSVLHGEREPAEQIAKLVAEGGLKPGSGYTTVTASDGEYAVTLCDDPVQDNAYLVSYVDVTALSAITSRVNILLIIIILAAILISVLLSLRFARSLASPVQTLSDFARDIGGGDLAPREMDFREVELSGLADSMNLMAAQLDESKRKQETFFQNVSHELRTPLTSIRGNAEGIVFGVMEPQAAGRVILSETDRLTSMVEDILYLSRMDRAADTKAEPIDIREVLSLCVSEQRLEAEERGIGFDFDFDDDETLFPIKETDAERIFGNIISNAVRYAKSRITLSCHCTGGSVTVRIRDDGPGIPGKDLPHIFERFYKGEGGRHGIGLAIAKSAVEAYHGSISAGNDGGAVFTAVFSYPAPRS